MDEALWLAHLRLPLVWRRRWVRSWFEHGRPDPAALDALATLGSLGELRAAGRAVLDATAAAGARCRTPLGHAWPERLRALHDPPGALFLKGRTDLLGREPAVGVIGARRGTERGRRVGHALGAGLARAGLPVISGLALGVDGAAHRGALEAGGACVAVLGAGIDRVHPPSHADLHRRVEEKGLLVSEYPPGTPPAKMRFVARNRILAALCTHLVVVEASARSGALGTVGFAQDLGVDVGVVPGPVDCPASAGTLQLLVDGATPVRGAGDVLDWMGLEAPPPVKSIAGVDATPRTPDEIARRLGRPLPAVLALLARAELVGEVRRLPGDRWIAAPAPTQTRSSERTEGVGADPPLRSRRPGS